MRKAILISAILIAIPATAPAMMGGYGSTGGGGSSSYNGGNSVVMDQAREDLKTGLRLLAAKQYADAIPFLQRALRAFPGMWISSTISATRTARSEITLTRSTIISVRSLTIPITRGHMHIWVSCI